MMENELGQDFYTLKKHLMEFHGETSTNLDKGIGIDYTVYLARRKVKVGGVWHWDDYVKFGRAKSIFNRSRIYNQPGDTHILWTIECISKEAATELERLIHERWQKYKPSENLLGTELYDIDQETAQKEFFSIIEDLGLTNDKNVIRGVTYTKNNMHVYDFENNGKKSVISFYSAEDALRRLFIFGD
jgi:hypothetical protein